MDPIASTLGQPVKYLYWVDESGRDGPYVEGHQDRKGHGRLERCSTQMSDVRKYLFDSFRLPFPSVS